jgi:4-diphosphocytidyl-2-C-methyl-D-erythritol kinase
VKSPAKLNLYLEVLGKRKDGYHELHTLFHRISLCDTLVIKKRKEGFFLKSDLKELPTDESNLITKAYRLLQSCFPDLGGVDVKLKKKIPVGAGLGGGSSNAASFLLAMNCLYSLGLTSKRLLVMARQLGADVPFFIYDKNQAVGTERGDSIRVRESKIRHKFLLIISEQSLSTQKVFQNYKATVSRGALTKKQPTGRLLSTFLDRKRYSKIVASLSNDLEKSAFLIRPAVRRTVEKIKKEGFEAVRMSGSGPTVFVLLPDYLDSKKMLSKVKRLFPTTRVELVETY